MNLVVAPGSRPVSVDLGSTPEFVLGGLLVCPQRRLIRTPAGIERELEPRVMQVLVALAQAKGEVVSRQALIDRCWNGRIVGDDAINRCIVSLRRIAKEIEPEPFAIETVPRVGYSLVERAAAPVQTESAPPVSALAATGERRPRRISARALAIAASVAVAVTGGVLLIGETRPPPPRTAAPSAAEQLHATATRLYLQRTAPGDAEAERLLRRAVAIDPGHAPSWARLAMVMRTPMHVAERQGAAEARRVRDEAMAYARRALALDPALGEAHVAMGQLLWDYRAKLPWYEKAVRLSPDNAEAWNGLGSALERDHQLGRALAAFQRALRLEPSFFPAVQNGAMMLTRMGRRDEARALVARAFDLGLSPARTRNTYALLDFAEGRLAEAAEHSAAVLADDPRHRSWPRLMILRVADILGDAELARRILRLDPTLAATIARETSPPEAVRLARKSPGRWWEVDGQGARARHLLNAGRTDLLVDLYRGRFDGPEALWRDCACAPGEIVPPLIVVLRAAGQQADATRLRDRWAADVGRLERAGDRSAGLAWQRAELAALGGDADAAAAALETAVARGWRGQFRSLGLSPGLDPVFAAVRSDSRVRAAIRAYDAAVAREAETLRSARLDRRPVL